MEMETTEARQMITNLKIYWQNQKQLNGILLDSEQCIEMQKNCRVPDSNHDRENPDDNFM